jgi:hypothetical protein
MRVQPGFSARWIDFEPASGCVRHSLISNGWLGYALSPLNRSCGIVAGQAASKSTQRCVFG